MTQSSVTETRIIGYILVLATALRQSLDHSLLRKAVLAESATKPDLGNPSGHQHLDPPNGRYRNTFYDTERYKVATM